ncbi:FadR/GntR family transcriptional regulator [Microtetraspora niveoalba]|uniref:FadR/GntR family transcriptional regulator n=1 Tax=Microtetraspora niveoalba TaxID=46175 RepID=UPI00082AE35E|nr:FCD domain-containing protein [Microtetraspora niveoalba]
MTAPVRQEPLVMQLCEQFRGLIDDGTWPIGSRIPGENQLASELGVSRGTVREALRALSMAGLLEPRVGDGTYVRARDELAAILTRDQRGDDLRHTLDVRSVLETAAAIRAARQRTEEDIRDLRRALADRAAADAAEDVDAYVEADAAFHRTLMRACGNPLLLRLYDAVNESMVASIRRTTSLPEDPQTGGVHAALADAVEAGDADRARACAAELFREVEFLSAVSGEPS